MKNHIIMMYCIRRFKMNGQIQKHTNMYNLQSPKLLRQILCFRFETIVIELLRDRTQFVFKTILLTLAFLTEAKTKLSQYHKTILTVSKQLQLYI
jgi:hypothetical protein